MNIDFFGRYRWGNYIKCVLYNVLIVVGGLLFLFMVVYYLSLFIEEYY